MMGHIRKTFDAVTRAGAPTPPARKRYTALVDEYVRRSVLEINGPAGRMNWDLVAAEIRLLGFTLQQFASDWRRREVELRRQYPDD